MVDKEKEILFSNQPKPILEKDANSKIPKKKVKRSNFESEVD